MSNRPDLTALEILVLVAETGSLGAAARRVGMAQPNASRALARLERQLGLTLVVRTPAGSRVTTEGEVVTAWAREALGAMDRMILGARSLAAEQAAHLTVAASLTIAEYLAPRWLARFRRAHTDLHVSLAVGNSGEVLEQLAARKIPLGFVETPTVPRTVASTTVARDEPGCGGRNEPSMGAATHSRGARRTDCRGVGAPRSRLGNPRHLGPGVGAVRHPVGGNEHGTCQHGGGQSGRR